MRKQSPNNKNSSNAQNSNMPRLSKEALSVFKVVDSMMIGNRPSIVMEVWDSDNDSVSMSVNSNWDWRDDMSDRFDDSKSVGNLTPRKSDIKLEIPRWSWFGWG